MVKQTIGVIGAGIMGQGVAYQFSKFGYDIRLLDISKEILENAKNQLNRLKMFDLLMQRQNKSPKGSSEDILDKISFSTDIACMERVDYIIENVPEKIDIKSEVYRKLSGVISDGTVVGVNTSATSITKLASFLPRPHNVLGLHFSNPVHLMPTVEMVKGFHTSEETILKAKELLTSAHMDGVLVNDSPGFITNRVMLSYINEAIYCIHEDVAPADSVDKIFRECLSHTMGPLQTADLIGLDTILFSLEVLYESFNDSKYKPCFLLKKMVDANLLGRKSGQGFYKYK